MLKHARLLLILLVALLLLRLPTALPETALKIHRPLDGTPLSSRDSSDLHP